MRITDRSLATIRDLSLQEKLNLVIFVTGKGPAPELLSSVRAERHWLACGCSYPSPVMHVAQLDNGRLVLKNNPETADHASNCNFLRDESGCRNEIVKSSHNAYKFNIDSLTTLHVEIQHVGRGNTLQILRSNAVERLRPRALLSLLLTLMEIAELDTFSPAAPRSLTDQYAAFRKASERFVLHPGIPLNFVLETKISNKRLVSMANKLRDLDAFGTERRYGILADVMQHTGPRQLVLNDGTAVDFFGNTESLHPRSAPMLAMATVAAQEAGSTFYNLGKVAFVPLLSGHLLFPVVDSNDRANVNDLLNLLRWMYEKRGVAVSAQRNLFQAGAGYVITLKFGSKLLEIDLNPTPLEGDTPVGETLYLSAHESLDEIKKKVMSVFFKDVPRD